MMLTPVLLPLFFGLTAWALALASVYKKALRTWSWCACALALWFPLLTVHLWVQKGDMSAIADCAQGYMVGATVLLAVTAALHLTAGLIRRKRAK